MGPDLASQKSIRQKNQCRILSTFSPPLAGASLTYQTITLATSSRNVISAPWKSSDRRQLKSSSFKHWQGDLSKGAATIGK